MLLPYFFFCPLLPSLPLPPYPLLADSLSQEGGGNKKRQPPFAFDFVKKQRQKAEWQRLTLDLLPLFFLCFLLCLLPLLLQSQKQRKSKGKRQSQVLPAALHSQKQGKQRKNNRCPIVTKKKKTKAKGKSGNDGGKRITKIRPPQAGGIKKTKEESN